MSSQVRAHTHTHTHTQLFFNISKITLYFSATWMFHLLISQRHLSIAGPAGIWEVLIDPGASGLETQLTSLLAT